MQEDFNPHELLDFLWQRRITLLAVPVVAVAIALCVGLLLSNKYTATATLIIEPPGGSDARCRDSQALISGDAQVSTS